MSMDCCWPHFGLECLVSTVAIKPFVKDMVWCTSWMSKRPIENENEEETTNMRPAAKTSLSEETERRRSIGKKPASKLQWRSRHAV